jgi:chorismate mutase
MVLLKYIVASKIGASYENCAVLSGENVGGKASLRNCYTNLVFLAETQMEDVITFIYLYMIVILLSKLKMEKDFVHLMNRQP